MKETIRGMAQKAVLRAKLTEEHPEKELDNWDKLFDYMVGREACATDILNAFWSKQYDNLIEGAKNAIYHARVILLDCYDAHTLPTAGPEYYSFADTFADRF